MTDYAVADITNLDLADIKAGYLLIERYPAEAKTKGGLELPAEARTERPLAWVAKVGPPAGVAPSHYHVGDTVVFPGHAVEWLPELTPDPEDKRVLGLIDGRDVLIHYPAEKSQ